VPGLLPQIAKGSGEPVPAERVSCYFDGGYRDTAIYVLGDLGYGQEVHGPAILMDKNTTILVC
jgi:5-oxoprolinase (ATP-hydrolysing)